MRVNSRGRRSISPDGQLDPQGHYAAFFSHKDYNGSFETSAVREKDGSDSHCRANFFALIGGQMYLLALMH